MKLPFSEILKSIPGFFGIRLEEEPRFEVVLADGDVEVRRYAPALLAEVTIADEHDKAVDEAFDRLAAYIFGENVDRSKLPMTIPARKSDGQVMAMTIPVGQKQEGRTWTVSFFLGNDVTAEDAPKPLDAGIRLTTSPARTVAVVRYSGNDTELHRTDARRKLREWLETHSELEAKGDVWWAQYDAPFVIPFLKRNEAQVEVTNRRSPSARR